MEKNYAVHDASGLVYAIFANPVHARQFADMQKLTVTPFSLIPARSKQVGKIDTDFQS